MSATEATTFWKLCALCDSLAHRSLRSLCDKETPPSRRGGASACSPIHVHSHWHSQWKHKAVTMCFCSCRQKKQVSKLKRGSCSCACVCRYEMQCAWAAQGQALSVSLVHRLSLSLLLSQTHTYVGNCKWLEHVGFAVVATGFSTVRISRILTLFKVHTQTLLRVCVRVFVCVRRWVAT